jgi:enoyl-CoA hydratase/carnithine racemase
MVEQHRGQASGPLTLSRDGHVARLTLNRPGARNAINTEMATALSAAVAALSDTRVVLVDACGPAFCAGLDIGEVRAGTFPPTDGIHALSALPALVIGVVEGPALAAGFDLALACDLIVAAPGAAFADLHLKLGLRPPPSLVEALVSRVGRHRALLMLMDATPVDAETAHQIGLVDLLVDSSTAGQNAREAATAIARAAADADPALVGSIMASLTG